ncbi:hypothetical protein F4824DRAFT_510519 [Ustulina deusta]|nr:hypothetical protein F4824DRAFT_510519 [Ustulina deusta]
MHFKVSLLLSAFAATAALGHALPVHENRAAEGTEGQLLPRSTTTMQAYKDINWTGESASFTVTTQTQCYRLGGTGWADSISSIQVSTGFRCRLWSSNDCNGHSTSDIYAPGAKELGNFNDKAGSFKCYQN